MRIFASRAHPGHSGVRVRTGTTVAELAVVLAVLGLLLILTLPRYTAATNRAAVQAAVGDAEGVFGSARRLAVTRRAFVAVAIDTTAGSLTIRTGGSRLGFQSLAGEYGVKVGATRDSMAYDPRGVGYGAADLSVILSRGQARETLFVARLGRIRY